ncbi:MAG TPA: hypothetical protein PL182_04495 [Pseudobdellovibrionaceae bacterium]|nr:hypothetical protein [Pseudobdellovibrionaceae bacterium]
MKTTLTLLFAAAIALSGCAFKDGEGNRDNEGRISEDLRQSRAKLAPIMGSWTGTLQRGNNSIEIEFNVQEMIVQTNTTANGQAVYSARPQASLISMDGRYNQTFTGTYLASESVLMMDSTQPVPLPLDGIRNLKLQYADGKLVGDATSPSGYLGRVTLTLQSRQSDGGQRDNAEEYANRLRRAYERIVGDWQGTVVASRGTPLRYDIIVSIFIAEEPTDTGRSMPVLRAYYDRKEDAYTGIHRKTMKVNYAQTDNPPSISIVSPPEWNTNKYLVSISGRLGVNQDGSVNYDEIVGTHTNMNLGITGALQLRKVSGSGNSDERPGSDIPIPTPRPRP